MLRGMLESIENIGNIIGIVGKKYNVFLEIFFWYIIIVENVYYN